MKLNTMFVRIGFYTGLLLLMGGCISVTSGTPLVLSGLDDLEIGHSSHAEVLLSLGQPRGEGKVNLKQLADPRDILFYEFMKHDGKTMELEWLVVFLHEERYDGHLWFGSTERIRKERSFLTVEVVSQGYFPSVDALEGSFVRGMTEKTEILEELGVPTGLGGAMLPPEHLKQDVLFYEEIEVGDMNNVGGESVMNTRQNTLLVLVNGQLFDGFMWYSSTGLAAGKTN